MNHEAPLIFLGFGRVTDVAAARAEEGGVVAAHGGGLGRQVALLGKETPAFRLNSPGWLAVAPELAVALDTRAMMRTLCRDRLMAATPAFAARTRRVVSAYLDRIDRLAGPPPERLDAVTDPTDRFFAALLPMPNAHIQPVTMADGGLVPVAGYDPVRVDLAFWDGERLTAILYGGASSRMPRQARALAALQQALGAGISVHDLEGATGTNLGGSVPARVFAAMNAMPAPIYGPYRAPAFRADLPGSG